MNGMLEAIVAGVTYNLMEGILWLEAEDGTHLPPIERYEERGPGQDGTTDLGFNLLPRVVSLMLGLGDDTIEDLYEARDVVRRIFRPRAAAIVLRWTLPNGAVRCLDVFYAGGLTMSSRDREGVWQRAPVQLRAPNPLFYDPVPVAQIFALGGGGNAFTVPMPVPTHVGASTIDQTRAVVYAGTWKTYPVLRIKGPITDPVITNTYTDVEGRTTTLILDLSGTAIGVGDFYDIDLRYAVKRVKDAEGADRTGAVSETSQLSTFHFAPDPDAADGVNSVRVTGTSVTAATEVYINYLRYYEAI